MKTIPFLAAATFVGAGVLGASQSASAQLSLLPRVRAKVGVYQPTGDAKDFSGNTHSAFISRPATPKTFPATLIWRAKSISAFRFSAAPIFRRAIPRAATRAAICASFPSRSRKFSRRPTLPEP